MNHLYMIFGTHKFNLFVFSKLSHFLHVHCIFSRLYFIPLCFSRSLSLSFIRSICVSYSLSAWLCVCLCVSYFHWKSFDRYIEPMWYAFNFVLAHLFAQLSNNNKIPFQTEYVLLHTINLFRISNSMPPEKRTTIQTFQENIK